MPKEYETALSWREKLSLSSVVADRGQNSVIMSEHENGMLFLRHLTRNDDNDDRCKLEKNIARAQRDRRFVQHLASVMALFLVLAIVGAGAMVAFAGLLLRYRKKLNRLGEECRRWVIRLLEPLLAKPGAATLAGSYRASGDREVVQGAAEVGRCHGSPESPSWLSNRICG